MMSIASLMFLLVGSRVSEPWVEDEEDSVALRVREAGSLELELELPLELVDARRAYAGAGAGAGLGLGLGFRSSLWHLEVRASTPGSG